MQKVSFCTHFAAIIMQPPEAATDTAKSKTTVETQELLLATSAPYSPLQSQSKDQERCLQKEHCGILQLYLCISKEKKKKRWKNNREKSQILFTYYSHHLWESSARLSTWFPHSISLALLHLPTPSTLPLPLLFHKHTYALEIVYAFTN